MQVTKPAWQNGRTDGIIHPPAGPSMSLSHLYTPKRQLNSPDKTSYNAILQLRTGYSTLNAHRHKVSINVPPLCACGVLETTDHFLLDCPIHESHRQRLCGISTLDRRTPIGTEDHPHKHGWRDMIQTELATYIQATDRFAVKPSDCDQSQSNIHI